MIFSTGPNAMSAVSPFDTSEACNAHGEYLFQEFTKMAEPEQNYYHLEEGSSIHYMEFCNRKWLGSWSCVPNIPYETE